MAWCISISLCSVPSASSTTLPTVILWWYVSSFSPLPVLLTFLLAHPFSHSLIFHFSFMHLHTLIHLQVIYKSSLAFTNNIALTLFLGFTFVLSFWWAPVKLFLCLFMSFYGCIPGLVVDIFYWTSIRYATFILDTCILFNFSLPLPPHPSSFLMLILSFFFFLLFCCFYFVRNDYQPVIGSLFILLFGLLCTCCILPFYSHFFNFLYTYFL